MTKTVENASRKSQRGLTLLEVLIYSVLSMVILVMATEGIGRLQKNAYRKQELARLHGDGDEVLRIIAQDARNLGLKRLIYSPSAGILIDTQLTRVDYAPADSSSFLHFDGNPYDTLTFNKPRLNPEGKPIAIDTIRYAVSPDSGILYRTLNGKSPVEICRLVDAFQLEYGLFATKTTLVNENPPLLVHWAQSTGGVLSQSGSSIQATALIAGTSAFWVSNSPLTLNDKHSYQLELRVSSNDAFLTNVDSLYSILCNSAGTPIARQSFLPTTSVAPLELTWSGIGCTGCYCGFQMVMKGAGNFQVTSLRLSDVEQGDGNWIANPTITHKKAVRAFRLYLLVRSSHSLFGIQNDTIKLANVTLAFQDKLGRSVLEDVVAIPNNGH